jgi:acid ceramidase
VKNNVKRFEIDSAEDIVEVRIQSLLTSKWAVNKAGRLVDNANKDVAYPISKLTQAWYTGRGTGWTHYGEEIKAWAKHAGCPIHKVISANLAYELSQIYDYANRKIGFCSSVAFNQPGIGMVHARNMDWPLDGVRAATCLVDHINGPAGDFTSISMPGMVGVLSGVAKGRFSVSINQAPTTPGSVPVKSLTPNLMSGWSALLLLRWVFENCLTYEDAVQELLDSKSIVPVFFQVVGAKRDQACVIEVMPSGNNGIYEYTRGIPLGISNHYLDDEDYEDSESEEEGVVYEETSQARLEMIEKEAKRCKAKSLKGCLAILRNEPVQNVNTQQSMVMCARTGEVLIQ